MIIFSAQSYNQAATTLLAQLLMEAPSSSYHCPPFEAVADLGRVLEFSSATIFSYAG